MDTIFDNSAIDADKIYTAHKLFKIFLLFTTADCSHLKCFELVSCSDSKYSNIYDDPSVLKQLLVPIPEGNYNGTRSAIRRVEYYTEPAAGTHDQTPAQESQSKTQGDDGPVYAEPFVGNKHPQQPNLVEPQAKDQPLPPPPLPKSRVVDNPIYDTPKEASASQTNNTSTEIVGKRQHKLNPLYNTTGTDTSQSESSKQHPVPAERRNQFKVNPLYTDTAPKF